MGTDATEAPHLLAGRASQDVVPLEGALLIGVETAGAKTVDDMMFRAQAVRDHPFGTGNFVRPLTAGPDHLPTTTATEILDIGLVLDLGIPHCLRYRKHPRIPPIPGVTRVCTR